MRVLVVTGATGGHIFPALAFLESLKAKSAQAETFLILPEKNALRQIPAGAAKVSHISIVPFQPKKGLKNIAAFCNFLRGAWQSLFILLTFRPDVVVGFGSLASLPAVFCAWIFRARIIIHEQNVIPGQANRLLAIFADRIAVSFPQTEEYFSRYRHKTVVTGNPLRKEMVIPQKQKAREFFGLPPERFTLMVMGGSQGSSRLNDTFLAAVSEAPLKDKLQVIHLAGTQDYQSIKQRYQDLNIEARVFVFLQEMQYAYGASDLAFSRAGATTITELMFFKLPAVISPYPYAYQHQSANAAILKNAGCAVILEEQQLTPESLRRQIEALINDQERLRDMRASYEKIFIPQAAEALVREAADVR